MILLPQTNAEITGVLCHVGFSHHERQQYWMRRDPSSKPALPHTWPIGLPGPWCQVSKPGLDSWLGNLRSLRRVDYI